MKSVSSESFFLFRMHSLYPIFFGNFRDKSIFYAPITFFIHIFSNTLIGLKTKLTLLNSTRILAVSAFHNSMKKTSLHQSSPPNSSSHPSAASTQTPWCLPRQRPMIFILKKQQHKTQTVAEKVCTIHVQNP